eukprot:595651-Alexandrium_andersonii.AAC.1
MRRHKPIGTLGLWTIIALNWREWGRRPTEGQSAGGAEEGRAGGDPAAQGSGPAAEGLGGADW